MTTPSEDSDQPGHPPSLIRVFAVCSKKAWVLSYPLSAQWRLWSDWADAQADLSLRWVQSFCWFCCEVPQIVPARDPEGGNMLARNWAFHRLDHLIGELFVICYLLHKVETWEFFIHPAWYFLRPEFFYLLIYGRASPKILAPPEK